MMTTELLQIEPAELRFIFELKKQTSCFLQLANTTHHYIAFKVKTTSPKKYCVRPNIGIINPNQKCDFSVTMQAQRTAPPDMQCKDKFLIQSTVVPFGTTEDHITSDMFAKDNGKYVEEKKLRVVLSYPPSAPLLPVNGGMKHDPSNEINAQKDRVPSGVENIPPPRRVSEEVKGLEPAQDTKEGRADEVIVPRQVENAHHSHMKLAKDGVELDIANEYEELKSKLSIMDSKLREAEVTINMLNEERRRNTREKDLLKKELELLKRNINTKGVQSGFPSLFVCMVGLISVAVGYYIHP
ncbi:hypothetical protein Fmac_013530 [Flemingia macrophylla]|uniref:MSP domain-containing protein n=1 Tax=Flemingia macrophylla TaxID=520843 RepID=A0ABD1MTH0_9FABA